MKEPIISRDESGVEAVLLPLQDKCNGYLCLDDGNVPLAMSYVPMQKIEKTYTPEEAFVSGTLFADLNKPFLGKRGVKA